VDSRIRVIVADDHPLFRDGVVTTLSSAAGIDVVGEADDAASAIKLAGDLLPDVALLDVAMPGGGLQAAREIARTCPSTRIVMLTVSEDEDNLMAAMKSGAKGYVLKGIAARDLVDIVRSIDAGEVYVAPKLAWRLLRELRKPRRSPLDELSAREREVLELVAEGLSNAEIGARLNVVEKTIKHHMTNILSKLQVSSRVEAALLAYKAGLGQDEKPAP
jgi:two-component system nitrate/nitrite response regulator NarL